MSDFDERSGVVKCAASWGEWWQTMEEVVVSVNVEPGIKSKEIRVTIKPRYLEVSLKGNTLIKGELAATVLCDESTWTLEDKVELQVWLTKADRSAKNTWRSLLQGQYDADPSTYDKMEQKSALQRLQFENPGMDFSGATISGQYQGGGPDLVPQ